MLRVFSELDANSGFWQVPQVKNSKLLTRFITLLVVSALRSSRLEFQMHQRLFRKGCTTYWGIPYADLPVFLRDHKEHERSLTAVLDCVST